MNILLALDAKPGFFGHSGDVQTFHYFGFAHFIPIILMIAVMVLICVYRKKLAEYKHEKGVRTGMAVVMLLTEFAYLWRLIYTGANMHEHLPLTVCGTAILFCIIMLFTENKKLFEISYFWAFGAGFMAILTPAVLTNAGPMYFRYYQFWISHGLLFISMWYMIFVKGYRPYLISMAISFVCFIPLAVLSAIANNALGSPANYLFMAESEKGASIVDLLPSDPALKMTIMGLLLIMFFCISYIPWLVYDIKKNKSFKYTLFYHNIAVSAVTDNSADLSTEQIITDIPTDVN